MKSLASVFILLMAFVGSLQAAPAPSSVPKKTKVLIIGAGLSGLATAHYLKEAGIPYHLLELGTRVGGRVRTVRYDRTGETLVADSGMEEYWESNPAVQFLKQLKLPVRDDVALSSIVLQKKLYPLKGTYADFQKQTFTEPERKALTAFKEKVTPWIHELEAGKTIRKELTALKDVPFSQWVSEQSLPEKVSEWIRVSIECEIGTGWERISALDGIAEFHIFLGEGERSYRVQGGNDKFTEALAKSIGLKHLSLNKRVNRLVTKGDHVTVSYLDTTDNKNGVIEASHVVSTIPIFRLFEVQFDPPMSEKKAQAIQSMTWGSYFKAHVLVSKTAERFWTPGGESTLPILSDSELGVIYDGNPEQNTKTKILSLLISGDHAERYNLTPLDQARTEIRTAFERLWPGFSKEILEIEFYRFHPRAIAAWPPGRSRFDELSQAVREPENQIYLAGDFTESSHSDGAFKSAARVAKQIAEAEKRKRALGSSPAKSSKTTKQPSRG